MIQLAVRFIVLNITEREAVFRVIVRSSTGNLATFSLGNTSLEAKFSLAEEGFDYISDTTLLTFPSGSTYGDELYINITIVDDSLVEGEEMLTIALESYDPSVQLLEVHVNITITDNEGSFTLVTIFLHSDMHL